MEVSEVTAKDPAETEFHDDDRDDRDEPDTRFLREFEERRKLERVELRVIIEVHTELHDAA